MLVYERTLCGVHCDCKYAGREFEGVQIESADGKCVDISVQTSAAAYIFKVHYIESRKFQSPYVISLHSFAKN